MTPTDLCEEDDYQKLRLGIAKKYRDGKGKAPMIELLDEIRKTNFMPRRTFKMTALICQSIRLNLVYCKLKQKTRLQSNVFSLEILQILYLTTSLSLILRWISSNPC